MMRKKAITLLMSGIVSLGSSAVAAATTSAPDPRAIPLVDQRGDTFRLSQLDGKATFVTFVSTRCAATCPIANGQFSRLDARLAAHHVPASFVTISLDPAYDTPFVMSNFARRFDPKENWRFATGRPKDVRALARSFGVVIENDRDGIPEQHSTFVYVLDPRVRLARTLLLSDDMSAEGERTARDLDARR